MGFNAKYTGAQVEELLDKIPKANNIWHSGNFNPSNYLPLSGGTMIGNILLGGTTTNKIGTNIVDTTGGWQEFTHQNSNGYIALGPFNGSVAHIYTDRPSFYFNKDLYVNDAKVWHAGNDGSDSGLDADLLDGKQPSELNVASATKLQTARTIWGQSFDGTGNVSGVLTLPLSHQVQWEDSGGAMIYAVSSKRIIIDGSVGIETTSPTQKLDVIGNIHTSGTLIQDSDIRLKNINKNVSLSLEDISNAPLFEFTYKSDENKRIHVGTSAQYWIEKNNWFCEKQDNGYYDMEIQNLALASAISIAKEFKKYKEETESTISSMKKEIKELKQIILNMNK